MQTVTKPDTYARTRSHVVAAIKKAKSGTAPFFHLQLSDIFPPDIYSVMLDHMPVKSDYRQMSGRTKDTRTDDGSGTRTKLDLYPEQIRKLPEEKRDIWLLVGKVLCSKEVREAFREKLAPGLEKRFGPSYRTVGMYPIPILTRDVAGYKIGIHPDTHWKGMTIQLYLPRDRSIEHVGTIFHGRKGDQYTKDWQMSFSPNTGYAFAVDEHTYHSVDTVGPEVKTRDSILLTYFVDKSPLQLVRNRAKRFGNMIRTTVRGGGS